MVTDGKYRFSHLISDELYYDCSVVCTVSDMILLPHRVLQHQDEENQKPQQMSPNVDSLVMKFEDALDAVLILQPLPVSRVDGYLFMVVGDLLDTEELEWLLAEHGVLMARVVCITVRSHGITGRMLTTMLLLHVLHAAHSTPDL